MRDPRALFGDSETVQKKCYRDATFAVDVSPTLPKGKPVHMVVVDWYKGVITAYADASDAMNNVPFFTGPMPLCDTQTAEHYVRETFRFLQRGHSLYHPECHCRNNGYCNVGTTGQGRSVREIEHELGVRSLYGLIEAGGELMPLMEVLVRLAGLRLHASNFLSSPVCCVPPEIKTADHIVEAARALYPRALLCAETPFGDLARLKAKGILRVLCIESTDQRAVFWCPPCPQCQVSADIRKLWESSVSKLEQIKKKDTDLSWIINNTTTASPMERKKSRALCRYHIAPDAIMLDEPHKKKRAPLRLYGSRRR